MCESCVLAGGPAGMAETRGRKEERTCVCVLPLRALGGCWRVSSGR